MANVRMATIGTAWRVSILPSAGEGGRGTGAVGVRLVDNRPGRSCTTDFGRSCATGRSPGFTMLEALVALVILGVLTLALSVSLAAALDADNAVQVRQQQASEARSALDALAQDIQAASASTNNPVSLFVGGGAGVGGTNTGVLMLSTMDHRITDPGSLSTPGSPDAQSAGGLQSAPQSDVDIVRYDYDPTTGALTRTALGAPNPTLLAQTRTNPAGVVANNIVSLRLSFWDSTQQTWRNDWDYEQSAQAGSQQAGQSGQQSSQTSGDTMLPQAVQIELSVRGPDGRIRSTSTTVPIVSPQPQDDTAPAAPTTSSGGQPSGGSPSNQSGGNGQPGGSGG